MVSAEGLAANVAALNARMKAIAKEYGLDASARLTEPQKSGVSTGELSIEVVVVKRNGSTPQPRFSAPSQEQCASTNAMET